MDFLSLALDWTPNVNHIGFFVAQNKSFYRDEGIDLNIVSPISDDYASTPAKKLEQGKVDFALCPIESLISFRTKRSPFSMVAIATLLQDDLSAIVCLEDSNIKRPRDLSNKIYGSYNARYEDRIVREMIKNDGGEDNLLCSYPKKLGIWSTLLSGNSDATWIFLNWEGVEAEGQGIKLKYFKLGDFGIPYSYSPVIAASESGVKINRGTYQRFLAATKKGFLFCQNNHEEAVDILRRQVPSTDLNINLERALDLSSAAFGTEETWGSIDGSRLQTFFDWLNRKELEKQRFSAEEINAWKFFR
tara:strand:+ start:178 stop:1086 length:909 start_codon:yes stop_codon:yes gene_type:complete